MSKTRWLVGGIAIGALAACGSKSSAVDAVAVGTYIGGGSIFGPETCEYAGEPGMFKPSDGKAPTDFEKGPRFVLAPGKIKMQCESGVKSEYVAVAPTGVSISGPAKLKVGAKADESFRDTLVAGTNEVKGEAYTSWELGPDCNGIAEFDAVMGAQDTGGKDRHRSLLTKAKGTCTILATAVVGPHQEGFTEQTFKAEKKVTIE